jgi:hypothetical protein
MMTPRMDGIDLPQAARRALCTVQTQEEQLDEKDDEVELMRQRMSAMKVRHGEQTSAIVLLHPTHAFCIPVRSDVCLYAPARAPQSTPPHRRRLDVEAGTGLAPRPINIGNIGIISEGTRGTLAFTTHWSARANALSAVSGAPPQTELGRVNEQLAFARHHPRTEPSLLPHAMEAAPAVRVPEVISLNTYSWEDKEASLLVWVEAAAEKTLQADSLRVELLTDSIKATVLGKSGRAYVFAQRLYQPIDVSQSSVRPRPYSRGKGLRIVTSGISGGRSLTRPFRHTRPIPLARLYPVPRATRTPRKFGRCPSFKDHSRLRRAEPSRYDSQLFRRCTPSVDRGRGVV